MFQLKPSQHPLSRSPQMLPLFLDRLTDPVTAVVVSVTVVLVFGQWLLSLYAGSCITAMQQVLSLDR